MNIIIITCDGCGAVLTDDITNITFSSSTASSSTPIQLCANCAKPLFEILPVASITPTETYNSLRDNISNAKLQIKG
jgi:hypothetical protein